jgi:hypothetical protein
MLDLICPARLPGWYQILKDLVPIWAALTALLAARIAYVGVLARIKFDRDQAQQRISGETELRTASAISRGVAMATEIRVRARDLKWFADQIGLLEDPREHFAHLRDHVFIEAWLRSITNTESAIDRGWRDLSAVDVSQRATLADMLAAMQTAAENVGAVGADVRRRATKINHDDPETADLTEDQLASLTECRDYGVDLVSTIRECLAQVNFHASKILLERDDTEIPASKADLLSTSAIGRLQATSPRS